MATVESPDTTGAFGLLAEWRQALVGVAGSTLSLALAEGRLAMLSGVAMVMLALWAAAFAFTAWLLLAIAAADAMQAAGLPLWGACLALAVLHVLVAFVCWRYVLHLSRRLVFPVTRRVVSQSLAASGVAEVANRVTKAGVDASQLPSEARGTAR